MSDPRHDASIPLPPQTAAGQANEVGAVLRAARERAGLDVAALAALLKVPRGRIESLEAGRPEELPDGVYARSLASSICRALRIDAQPVLALLPHAVPRSLDSVAEHKTTRIKSSVAAGRGKFSASARTQSHVSRRALAIVSVLVLAAAAIVLTPPGAFERIRAAVPALDARPGDAAETVTRAGGRVVEEVSLPSAGSDTVHPADSAPSEATGALAPATPSSVAGATAPASDAPAGAPQVPASVEAAAPAVPAAGADAGGLLVISASAPTWIKVSDAKGAVLVQKTLGAGQVERVPEGAGPLSVTVGRVDAATVQVRGEAFDLASRARNNVARFEVK